MDKYLKANRDAWNEAAPIHARHKLDRWLEEASKAESICLDKQEIMDLTAIGLSGKDVAQICCNNGRELISIKKLGADRCVGFDGSAGFLQQATLLNEKAGTDCEFVCTNIYDIDSGFYNNFDLIYISIGVLIWMPDLNKFFSKLSRLLKKDAQIYIYEEHPILEMIEPGDEDSAVEWNYSYFQTEPFEDNDGLDYWSNEKYESKTMYTFVHKLSDVFTAALENSLRIEKFKELPNHISNTFYNVEKQGPELPMSYVLVLRKS